jgi:hypothetical protein
VFPRYKNQLVAVETTGMFMDTSKQQTSPRIPQRYTSGRSDTIRSMSSCVEAESNTSTVALRVVGGDENGSLKSETVKCEPPQATKLYFGIYNSKMLPTFTRNAVYLILYIKSYKKHIHI